MKIKKKNKSNRLIKKNVGFAKKKLVFEDLHVNVNILFVNLIDFPKNIIVNLISNKKVNKKSVKKLKIIGKKK